MSSATEQRDPALRSTLRLRSDDRKQWTMQRSDGKVLQEGETAKAKAGPSFYRRSMTEARVALVGGQVEC